MTDTERIDKLVRIEKDFRKRGTWWGIAMVIIYLTYLSRGGYHEVA